MKTRKMLMFMTMMLFVITVASAKHIPIVTNGGSGGTATRTHDGPLGSGLCLELDENFMLDLNLTARIALAETNPYCGPDYEYTPGMTQYTLPNNLSDLYIALYVGNSGDQGPLIIRQALSRTFSISYDTIGCDPSTIWHQFETNLDIQVDMYAFCVAEYDPLEISIALEMYDDVSNAYVSAFYIAQCLFPACIYGEAHNFAHSSSNPYESHWLVYSVCCPYVHSGEGNPPFQDGLVESSNENEELASDALVPISGNDVWHPSATDIGNSVTPNSNARIYPNPATEQVHFSAAARLNSSVRILNVDGSIVQQKQIQLDAGETITFDLKDLPPSIYYMQWLSDDTWQTQRFVKLE